MYFRWIRSLRWPRRLLRSWGIHGIDRGLDLGQGRHLESGPGTPGIHLAALETGHVITTRGLDLTPGGTEGILALAPDLYQDWNQ